MAGDGQRAIHAENVYLTLRIFRFQEPSWKNASWTLIILVVDLVLAWPLYRFEEQPIARRMRKWKESRDERKRMQESQAAPQK